MALWSAFRPILALFLTERRAALLAGALLAAATVLAGIALLGLSGWFITATAIAGLSSATAFAFDVFAPAAAIRFLALARTAARYGERLTTHDATLGVLAGLRVEVFRNWAQPQAAQRLLKRPARLLFRLTADIDAGRREPGTQQIMIDMEQSPAGRYFVEIISNNTRIAQTTLIR